MGSFERRVALVTGGTSGIGLGIARALVNEGARVAITGRNADRGEAAARSLQGAGECRYIQGDASRSDDVDVAVERTARELGPPEILINNAGLRILGRVTDLSEEQWDQVIDADLKSVFLFSRRCIPLMAARGGGVIINIGSAAARGRPNRAAYAAAKAGMLGLTRAMALDHLSDGIRVNCVVPGFVLSGMTVGYGNDRLEVQAARSVAGRVATPEDIAPAILFLAGASGATVTGVVWEMGSTG